MSHYGLIGFVTLAIVILIAAVRNSTRNQPAIVESRHSTQTKALNHLDTSCESLSPREMLQNFTTM